MTNVARFPAAGAGSVPAATLFPREGGSPARSEDQDVSIGVSNLSKAARQFEAVFLRQMIASMRSATPGDTLFGSDATNQFRDMSDARLADAMSGRFGIAAMLERQLSK